MQLFLAFIVALSVTTALVPPLSRWAPALGLTDRPGPRKVHSVPVPRVGGIAMSAGLLIPALVTVPMTPAMHGILAGIVVLFAFGLWDDRVDLDYRLKFLGQVIAVALCMGVGGLRIDGITLDGMNVLPGTVSTAITFVFLIGITNAVNLADGLDGLAGGLVLLCLCAVALFAVTTGHSAAVALCLIEAGAILGFLRFNTHPARIFMGDSGSQVLGFSVGALALVTTQGQDNDLSPALPLLLLGLPILDTLTVMSLRIRAGRSPFSPDRSHLHHRLLALGFSHRESVAIIYVLQVSLVLLAYFLRYESDLKVVLAFAVFAAATLGLMHWARSTGWRFRSQDLQASRRSRLSLLPYAARLPGVALGVMVVCLAGYAATVLTESRRITLDLGLLSGGMLVVLLLPSLWRARRSFQMFERAVAYVSVVLLVYLDQASPDKPALFATASWALIGITGAAALARFWLSPTRRFEVTTLDLIVVFIALVLPNLPGSVAWPADLPQGIAKAVILLYVVEMLLNFDYQRLTQRVLLGATLAAIAGRAFLGAGL